MVNRFEEKLLYDPTGDIASTGGSTEQQQEYLNSTDTSGNVTNSRGHVTCHVTTVLMVMAVALTAFLVK